MGDPTSVAVSVVIPVKDGAAELRRTLDHLVSCDVSDGVTVEIVVADDGSTDGSQDVARSFGDRVHIVAGVHSGPAAARNRGATAATGEVLVFVDCGDRPQRGWLASLAEPFRDAGVGAATWSADVHDVIAGATVRVTPTRFGTPALVGLPGCFAVRRSVFDRIGGYDPALRFGENSDLCARLRTALREEGLGTCYLDAVLTATEFGEPAAAYDRRRLESVEHLLWRDRAALLTQPSRRARLHGIAAVNAGRCDDWRQARRHAWAAARAEPQKARHYLRAAMTLVPPIARWRWTSEQFRRRMPLVD